MHTARSVSWFHLCAGRRSRRFAGAVVAVVCLAVAALSAPSSSAAPTSTTGPSGLQLALTPPMGYNNWAATGCSANVPNSGDTGPSEAFILAQATALTTDLPGTTYSLKDRGYDTVTIDDCWMTSDRSTAGQLQSDSTKFPHGMAYIGSQLHNLGLKFGIYLDSGTSTCGNYAGSWGHYQDDADQIASWGVDYVKLDGCNMPSSASSAAGYITAYNSFSAALQNNASHRPIVFSESSPAYFYIGASSAGDLSDWYSVIDAASKSGQLWREGNDVVMHNSSSTNSRWDYPANGSGILTQYGYNSLLARYSAPGSFNDPDVLITGDGLTADESKTQFGLWAMMASPLILGVDLTALSTASQTTLSNADVIAIDQDPLARQAGIVSRTSTLDVLAKPLSNGDIAVALLNRGSSSTTASTSLSRLGLIGSSCSASVKELWAGTSSTTTGSISATVPSHSTEIYRLTPSNCTQETVGQITSGIDHYGSITVSKCLDVSASPAAGVNLVLYSCNGGVNQSWSMPGDGTIRATSNEQLCVDATANSSDAVLNSCDGRDSEKWTYGRNGSFTNEQVKTAGGGAVCLDDSASSTADNTPILTATCANTYTNQQNQMWAVPTVGGGPNAATAP